MTELFDELQRAWTSRAEPRRGWGITSGIARQEAGDGLLILLRSWSSSDFRHKASRSQRPPLNFPPLPSCSVGVTRSPSSSLTASWPRRPAPSAPLFPIRPPLSIPVKPGAGYAGLSLPRSGGRGMVHSSSGGLAQAENGAEGAAPHGAPSGVSPRVQAARYKFQEQDQNGSASQSPPSRDLSPTNRDHLVPRQQALHQQSRSPPRAFTSTQPAIWAPAGRPCRTRPSEGGPFPAALGHPLSSTILPTFYSSSTRAGI
ncbi:unnamed protein product [Boreogadus saida]